MSPNAVIAKAVICTVAAEVLQTVQGPLGSPVTQKVHQYTFQHIASDTDGNVILPQPLTLVTRDEQEFVVEGRYVLVLNRMGIIPEPEN